jgi:hypothetical protein
MHSETLSEEDGEQYHPKRNSTLYMCVCQAFFDFSKHYYCDIGKNTESCFY